jgi:hypothetical protein
MWPQTHSTPGYIDLYDSMIISVIICNLHFFLVFHDVIYFLVHIGYENEATQHPSLSCMRLTSYVPWL